ncbi:MAG: hypothetical protein AUH99_14120 [Candidatus Rokubacteria bacterium 13_2_20CM_2_70_11]|nr:MAG: hypothetical protein AUH99_14120 [Candidatus Rokubacteria bacterium 13_2_20CM_2_70_11]
MDQWCADLAAVLAAERAPRAVVGGHCLGANVAVEFATRRPDAVAGLVLIEPMLREALRGSLKTAVRLRSLLGPAVGLIRAVNALGIYRRRVARLDLTELDRETRAAMSRGASEALLRRHASLWLDLSAMPAGAYRPPSVSGPSWGRRWASSAPSTRSASIAGAWRGST